MRWYGTTILTVLMLLMLSTSSRAEDGSAGSSAQPAAPKGSIASQLTLRYKLEAANRGLSLATALNHSREEWERLLPDQRDRIRRVALAILKESDEKQQVIIERWKKLQDMTPERLAAYQRRARIYKAVLAAMTPEQREELKKMSLKDRARRILTVRDRLIDEGKLSLDEPTTQPSDESAEDSSDTTDPNDVE
ncbi:MAG: hypothetical protein ACOCWV_02605 [Planctomycetota bacterium]